jgi:uncharacterized membrane protein (DUF4010 family)
LSIKNEFILQCLAMLFIFFGLLPMVPDIAIGPYSAINPHDIAKLTLVIIIITVVGNLLLTKARLKHAFLLTGFFGGFTSSTATVIAMANFAKQEPALLQGAAAAASASNIATFIQMSILISLINSQLFLLLLLPLTAGAMVATMTSLLIYRKAHGANINNVDEVSLLSTIKRSVLIVLMLSIMLVMIAYAKERLGHQGVNVAAFLSGLVDGHASAISISELASLGIMPITSACVPVLIGLSSNAIMRTLFSILSKSRSFTLQVGGSLLLSVLVTWMIFLAMQVR